MNAVQSGLRICNTVGRKNRREVRISSDWKNSKSRQSDMDRDRGKTIRLGFKGKGEESSEENCWREEKKVGQCTAGGGRVGYQSDDQACLLHCRSYYT